MNTLNEIVSFIDKTNESDQKTKKYLDYIKTKEVKKWDKYD